MFSTTFRDGLISLLELAGADELLQAGAIAARHRLSQHDLSVVLGELRRLGLVQSHKGKNGGYRLIWQPSDVSLLFLYRALAGSPPADATLAERESAEAGAAALVAAGLPSGGNVADAWLGSVAQRWSAELESTSLADLQNWCSSAG